MQQQVEQAAKSGDEPKKERLQFSMTSSDRQKLEDIANRNAAGNLSHVIRVLINQAYENPELFGLIR